MYTCSIYKQGLTGQPPFRGLSLVETLRQVVEQVPAPPRLHNPRLDAALQAICLKCLEKTPRDRYTSAEALAEDLAAYLRGEAVQAHRGTAGWVLRTLLRESRYTEIMTLWSGVWMGLAVLYLFICGAKSLLLWNQVTDYGPFVGIWLGTLLGLLGLAWVCRFRNGPPLSQVERQLAQLWCFSWIGFLLTSWQYQRTGGPVAGLIPLLVLEGAVAFACMATILGGSFYAMAGMCVATAVLESLWPAVGPLISAAVGSPALFWLGWKYSRRVTRE